MTIISIAIHGLPEEKGKVLELIEEGLRVSESKHIDAKDMIGMRL